MYKKHLVYILGIVMLFYVLPVQAQTQTPGGSTNVDFAVWLTPNSYSNGVWTNRISSYRNDNNTPW